METRDIVLSLLIVSVGAAIFYMLDPTLGGVLKAGRKEGFANNNAVNYNNVVPASDSNLPGMNQFANNANGAEEAYNNANSNHAVNNNTGAPAAVAAESTVEGFETLTPAPMPFKDAEKPSNCYPKDQINPSELLPNDPNSKWAQVNPMGQGDIAGKNYLSAGALIGVNTIGQSLRNANYQLRSDPPNPQVKVSIWNQATIEPDVNRRSLEIG
jgi:hypothetical protein